MKSNLITLLVSAAVLVLTLWARQTWPAAESAHGRYYMAAILAISAIVALIAAVRLFRHQGTRSVVAAKTNGKTAVQQRQNYRIRFETSPRPRFVQKIDDRQRVASFSCPVCDLSETGISLDCTGIYAEGQTVQGEIIFDSGRTAPVNGLVIREEPQRTCLRLHCTIDPPLLMAEQREQIIQQKASGPLPAVSETMRDTTAKSLPSHSPKGICRLKRP